jgi:O-succinylbenzoic acid--CoA ligase
VKAITLNHQNYPLEWLLDPATEIERQSLPAYDKTVLRFCRQWLSGQESFTLTTSGSTGRPKLITLTRQQMVASARATGQALGLQTGDRALVCLSTQYIAGMMMLVRGFGLGLALTIVDPTGNPLLEFPDEARFDFCAFVPLQLQQILAESPGKLSILDGMKAILVGGAPVTPELEQQLQTIAAPVYHTYGMTETVTHVALKRLNGPKASDTFIPLPGVEVGLDRRGCLTVKGALTNNQTVYTNDLAELRPDGSFTWLGRLGNVINSGGVKVQIEKVEAALAEHLRTFQPGRRLVVGPLPHPQLGQTVVAVIEGEPLSSADQTELRSNLQRILTKYEIPRSFYFLPSLPETPTGKIDRVACLEAIAPNLKRTQARK